MLLHKSVSSVVASRCLSRTLLGAALASLLLAGSAGAQIRGTQSTPNATVAGVGKAPAVTISYKQKTTYDFDEEQVEGTTVRPDVDLVEGRTGKKQDSLIRLRSSFQDEMLKSVESL